MLTWVVRGVLTLVLLAAVAIIAGLAWRAARQHEIAQAMAITSQDGVSQAEYLDIGGIKQFVDIRGEHRGNPALLIVTGGPGGTLVPLETLFRPWEKQFTIVQWDQRGAGLTYEANGPQHQGRLTIAQYARDGLAVAQYVRLLLHKQKIVVLGHSWGSIVALRMIKERPDLFSAYVGTGQVVDSASQEAYNYNALLKKVRAANDASGLATLTRIGAPPYKSLDDVLAERSLSSRYDTDAERRIFWSMAPVVLTAPNYTLEDIYSNQMSTGFAAKGLVKEIMAYDARGLGTDFAVPVFILNGDKDAITPMALSKSWFDTLRPPQKEYVVLEGGGHDAVLTMPDRFLAELLKHVWPVARASDMAIIPPARQF